MSERIYRRDLLLGAGAAGLLGACPAIARQSSSAAGTDASRTAFLRACREFWARCDGARVIGETYWRTSGNRPDRAALLARLVADVAAARLPARPVVTPEAFRALIASRVRADFSAGRVTRLGGWLLSETEVRLCALAALDG